MSIVMIIVFSFASSKVYIILRLGLNKPKLIGTKVPLKLEL